MFLILYRRMTISTLKIHQELLLCAIAATAHFHLQVYWNRPSFFPLKKTQVTYVNTNTQPQ